MWPSDSDPRCRWAPTQCFARAKPLRAPGHPRPWQAGPRSSHADYNTVPLFARNTVPLLGAAAQRQPMLIMTKAAAPCSGARAPTRAGAASCEDQPHPAQKGTWLGSHGAHEELSPGGQRSPARSGRAKLRQQQVSTAYASAKARRGCRRGCPASTPGGENGTRAATKLHTKSAVFYGS